MTRHLRQKSKTVRRGDTTKQEMLDEFYIRQDQTCYRKCQHRTRTHDADVSISLVIEYDPHELMRVQRCQAIHRTPYRALVRFTKFTDYSIMPSSRKAGYEMKYCSNAMFEGPFGGTWSGGGFKPVESTEMIRDGRGVWRDGDGNRLRQPKSTWQSLWADLRDLPGTTDRKHFGYRLPVEKLVEMAHLL